MKTKLFTIALLFASISMFAQTVARDKVILEYGTATW